MDVPILIICKLFLYKIINAAALINDIINIAPYQLSRLIDSAFDTVYVFREPVSRTQEIRPRPVSPSWNTRTFAVCC